MFKLQIQAVNIDAKTRLRTLALAAVAVGISLHSFEMLADFPQQARSLSFALLIWSCLPYLLALLLIFTIRRTLIPLLGVSGPLIVDLINHYFVYMAPASSTAGLNLFWIPLWNMIFVEPLGWIIGWGIAQDKGQRAKNRI